MMVENGDERDMNPLPEYQGMMSSRSTTAWFSHPDVLKLALFVSFFEMLY